MPEYPSRATRAAGRGRWGGPDDWARVGSHLGRAAARAGRGRWWFTEGLDDAYGDGPAPGGAPRPRASREERISILTMLQEGKITSEQAAKLLEALGV